MDEVLLLITNLPDRDSAQHLANKLVEQHAAACVNILAECTSIYRWEGKIESTREVPLLIKTTRTAYKRAEELILELHPYELPEIIAVSIVAGLPAYLKWANEEVSLIN
jgi:periplasmic divalent cation tolerance protein